jgi:hypothetical protein
MYVKAKRLSSATRSCCSALFFTRYCNSPSRSGSCTIIALSVCVTPTRKTSCGTPFKQSSLHLDQLGELAGIGAATVLSILVLVLISSAAGIAARTAIGGRISRWSEASLLGRLCRAGGQWLP